MAWLPKQKVVVPIDFSDESLAAVDEALQLVESPAAITVVHILPELSVADPGVVWQTIDNENRRSHTEEAIRERLGGEKYAGLRIEVDFGDPGYRIAEFARKWGAELIVIPSHGRTGVQRLLIGSVAERVLRLAHCPVLVLRS